MVASDTDKLIGSNVALWRGDMSQQALAEAMRDAGHPKWSQSTVWSVEKGDRPLRLTEAESLQEILGDGAGIIFTMPPETALLGRHLSELRSLHADLVGTLVEYLDHRNSLALAAKHGTEQPPTDMAEKIAEWLGERGSAEEILRQAYLRFGSVMSQRDRMYPHALPGHSAETDEAYLTRAAAAEAELAEAIAALRKVNDDAE